jgi:hypothetical protein
MAGAIAELAKGALAAGFCSIDSRCARIVLVEAGAWLPAPFDPSIGFRNRLTGAVSWCWELRQLPARRAPDHRDS